MDAPAQYLEELRGELGVYPMWFPGDPIELGAFGTIVSGRFVADGRLSDLGIAVVSSGAGPKLELKKQRGMKLSAVSSTTARAGLFDAELGVDLEVRREYAWAFGARGTSKTEIGNMLEVQRTVLEAHRAGDWRKSWLVVSEVWSADHLSVLVARSKQAKGKIRAKGSISEPIDILLQEEVHFELSTEDVFQVRNAKHTTPLYGLRKLKGFFDPQLVAVRGNGTPPAPSAAVAVSESGLEIANDEPFFAEATPD